MIYFQAVPEVCLLPLHGTSSGLQGETGGMPASLAGSSALADEVVQMEQHFTLLSAKNQAHHLRGGDVAQGPERLPLSFLRGF